MGKIKMSVPNPYQPPAADFDYVTDRYGELSVGRAISDAWRATKQYFPLWVMVGLVGAVLCFLSAITVVGYFLLLPVFGWGMTRFLLNMVDGRAEFGDLFSGFSQYGRVLGRTLLVTLCIVLLALLADSVAIAGQLMESMAVQAVGSVLYLAFTLTVLIRLYFAWFFLVDRDLSAMEALSASWNATRGKNLQLVGLALLSGLIAMAGLLALLIGVFFTMTMAYVSYASAYRQLVGPPRR
jgi:uncharacterized membrane protein